MKDVLTIDEIAERLGIHRNTATEMIRDGVIRARRAGTKWLVPVSAFEEYMAGLDNPRIVYSAEEVAGRLGLHVNTVAAMLQEGTIRARRKGRKWLIPVEALKEYLSGRDN